MLNQEDLYKKLNFSEVQLDSIRQIYAKYFEQHMYSVFKGKAFIAIWNKNYTFVSGKKTDTGHNNPGITISECEDDILWQNFADLLPHMSKFAVITKLQPGEKMWPHVDRKSRPPGAIYFPIKGCTIDCPSYYYDLPKKETDSAQSNFLNPTPLYTFAVADNAMLETTREWHSVENKSQEERVAFGWNMKMEYSFDDCKSILKELKYID